MKKVERKIPAKTVTIPAKTVTEYISSDGRYWKTEKQCKSWEDSLEKQRIFNESVTQTMIDFSNDNMTFEIEMYHIKDNVEIARDFIIYVKDKRRRPKFWEKMNKPGIYYKVTTTSDTDNYWGNTNVDEWYTEEEFKTKIGKIL